jgi:NAD(P)-dependent dehydrogenase (short-subunit alcohol dehydrogenase family)
VYLKSQQKLKHTNMLRLENKVAIVTGGATGIGEAISKKFAKEGAKVIVNGYPQDPVNDVVEEIKRTGGEAAAFVADISIEQNAQGCIEFAVNLYGKLDILINNAGTFPAMDEIDAYPSEAFDYMIKNNVRSAFLMTKYAIPELKETRGCIVSAGSEAGEKGEPRNTPYGGTKGFIHAFMKGVAVEQAQYGVRANCVCPGAIDTAWTHHEDGPMKRKDEKIFIAGTPLGRRGTPEEVANVYLFLASDEASYVTGSLYPVDGGITVAKGPVGEQAGRAAKDQPEGELHLEHSMDGATDMERGNLP